MGWMAAGAERRGSPRVLWPQARSIIMLGLNYGGNGNPLAILRRRERGAVSVYAQGDDYHDVIKPLKAIWRWLTRRQRRRRRQGRLARLRRPSWRSRWRGRSAGLSWRDWPHQPGVA